MRKIIVIFAILILAACSNPKDPTKANFKKALQNYIAQEKACLTMGETLPYIVTDSEFKYFLYRDTFSELVKISLFEVTETEKDLNDQSDVPSWLKLSKREPKIVPAKKYDLSEKGRNTPSITVDDKEISICYGKYKIADVQLFTEPTAFFGATVSEVTYTYQLTDAIDWVKNNKLLSTKYGQIRNDLETLDKPGQRKATLVLTSEGWVHEKLAK